MPDQSGTKGHNLTVTLISQHLLDIIETHLHTVPTWLTLGKPRTHTGVQVSITISTMTLPVARANADTYPFSDDDVIFCR